MPKLQKIPKKMPSTNNILWATNNNNIKIIHNNNRICKSFLRGFIQNQIRNGKQWGAIKVQYGTNLGKGGLPTLTAIN